MVTHRVYPQIKITATKWRARHIHKTLHQSTGINRIQDVVGELLGLLNGYSYANGNPVNLVDPSGMVPLNIWVAAFIEPPSIVFPYPYQEDLGIDFNAVWHGDGRTWYSGGPRPSARGWFSIQVDTADIRSLVWDRDTEVSYVQYIDNYGISQTRSAKAPRPDDNSVSASRSWWSQAYGGFEINVKASISNPLIPYSPPIDFSYAIDIIPCLQRLDVYAWHDLFPWHELYVELDGNELLYVRDAPSGPFKTPGDLSFPAIRPTLHTAYNARLQEGTICTPTIRAIVDALPDGINLGCI